jgi:hypothetical protein
MHAGARRRARRRIAVVATAIALVGAMAPAAMAKAAPKPAKVHAPAPPKPLPRTGLIVSTCTFSHRSNDDPIVYPNLSGVSHSHDFFGNATTDASSTYASLLGHSTTCGVAGDTAAYWAPTLSVNGIAVKPAALGAYYAVFGTQPVHPLPAGLEMIAKGAGNVHFSCFSHSMPTQAFTVMPSCKPGQLMAIGVNFPSCWNGADLDSPDHMSHMTYPVHNVCPAGYPVIVPRLSVWVMYKAVPHGSVITLSSGALDTAHADYIQSWNQQTLSTLENYCLVGHRECYKEMGLVLRKLRLAHNKLGETVSEPPAGA